jgi:hypothetical protein
VSLDKIELYAAHDVANIFPFNSFYLYFCFTESVTMASVVTETIDTVRWQMFKKGQDVVVESAHVQGQRIHERLLPTMPICLL